MTARIHWIEIYFCGEIEAHDMHIWGAKKTEGGSVRYRCTGLHYRRNDIARTR